jgi:hypothetical protein
MSHLHSKERQRLSMQSKQPGTINLVTHECALIQTQILLSAPLSNLVNSPSAHEHSSHRGSTTGLEFSRALNSGVMHQMRSNDDVAAKMSAKAVHRAKRPRTIK